ncbi:MAG: gluconokinase [Acidobacteriota bacterium]
MSFTENDLTATVLSIDVGSSSVRAIVYDAEANPVKGLAAHRSYEFNTTADGGVEVDASFLTNLVFECLDQVAARLKDRGIRPAGVAISTFWHNLLGIDAGHHPVTPIYSWADTRSLLAAQELKERLDERQVHSRTGCVFHTSYLPAKILWLQKSRPELVSRVVRWVSVGEFLETRLFGAAVCSFSMASGTGLFDQNRCDWDRELLGVLQLETEQLSPLADFNTPQTELLPEFAERWPALHRSSWFPALGDGACSNLGCGCHSQDRAALMVGTSGAMRVLWRTDSVTIPWGLWCYHLDRSRFLIGGALSNGGLLFDWLLETLRLEGAVADLEDRLAGMKPDAHGLTILPFLAGERSPQWKAHARAAIVGLSLHSTPWDILRAALESVAYRFANIAGLLNPAVPDLHEVIASGGALLRAPLWIQIMADVLGRPVIASEVPEASSRGAALMALEALGIVSDGATLPAPTGQIYHPDEERHARYQEGITRQQKLYQLLYD